MDLPFPERYHAAVQYFDVCIGDVAQSPLLTDAQRLVFYALRQQAEHGPCTGSAPSIWQLTERYKHMAWQQLQCMSTFEAMVRFVHVFEQTLWALEHPEKPPLEMEKPLDVRIDWKARLRDILGEAPAPDEKDADSADKEKNASAERQKTEGSNAEVKETSMVTERSSASPPPPPPQGAAAPHSSSSRLESPDWDADVLAHLSPTQENIRFLARELMCARQTIRGATGAIKNQAASPSQAAVSHVEAAALSPAVELTPPSSQTVQQTASASSTSENSARASAVPPPLRPSARSMTEAAVRHPLNAPHVRVPEPAAPPAQMASRRSSWFGW